MSSNNSAAGLLLEDGTDLLAEDGVSLVGLEFSVTPSSPGYDLLLEDGTGLLAEDGWTLGLESAPTPTPTVCFADPCAATLVMGPGRLWVVQGLAVDWPFQILNRDGRTAPVFGPNDTLAAAIYQRRVPTPVCTPAVSWYTAPDPVTGNPTQNGYSQGQVLVSPVGTDTASLQPTGGPLSYTLVVTWSPAAIPSKSVEIVRLPLAVGRDY